MPCLFFDNLFWFLKFYFKQFNLNLKLIVFDFLVIGEIERIKIKMKRMLNINDVP